MSTEALSAVEADLARVTSAQTHLAAAQANEVPVGTAAPGDVQRGHAAVAAAEAVLAQAQAALNAARAVEAAGADPETGGHHEIVPPPLSHLVDTVA